MKLPPMLARLEYGGHSFWIPVFLLWPLILLLFALMFFAGVIALGLLQKSPSRGLGRFLFGLYETICASRGTQLDFDASGGRISLTLR